MLLKDILKKKRKKEQIQIVPIRQQPDFCIVLPVIVCEHRRLSWLYVDTKLNSIPLLFMQSVTWNGYTTHLLVLNLHSVVLVSGTWCVHVNPFVTSSLSASGRTKLDLGQQIVLSLFLSHHRHLLLHLTWRLNISRVWKIIKANILVRWPVCLLAPWDRKLFQIKNKISNESRISSILYQCGDRASSQIWGLC